MNIGCVLLAAGLGTRFGGDKLLARVDGETLAARTCRLHAALPYALRVLVARPDDTALLAEAQGYVSQIAYNPEPERGIASSVCAGLRSALSLADAQGLRLDGALFGVCDQPKLRQETVQRLLDAFCAQPDRIVAPVAPDGRRGNPAVFPAACFCELLQLTGDRGGGALIARRPELLLTVPVPAEELQDVDTRDDAALANAPRS